MIAGFSWRRREEQQQPWTDWEAREWGGNNLKLSKTFLILLQTWVQGSTLFFEFQLPLKEKCLCDSYFTSRSPLRGPFSLPVYPFSVLPLCRSGQKLLGNERTLFFTIFKFSCTLWQEPSVLWFKYWCEGIKSWLLLTDVEVFKGGCLPFSV